VTIDHVGDERPAFSANRPDSESALSTALARPSLLDVRDEHGLAERFSAQSTIRRRKRHIPDQPTDQLNLRAAISDINTFVEWCERNRYSYREGFGELVKGIAARSEDATRARG
jgi:hypothetical protein